MMDRVVYLSLFENIHGFQLFMFKDFLLKSLHVVNSPSLGLTLRKQDVKLTFCRLGNELVEKDIQQFVL